MPPKILVTGANGQLGSDLVLILKNDYDLTPIDIDELNITDESSVRKYLALIRPNIIIHSAAYTDVDGCETNIDLAMSVNAEGTKNIALTCKEISAKMIYFSTDYVFNGEKSSPYRESDNPDPVTVYGRSKLLGEQFIQEILDDYVIIRIAWLYGFKGHNFVKTIIKLGQQQMREKADGMTIQSLKIVNDQTGNPTWSRELALQTKCCIENDLKGLFHGSAGGECSWYEFAKLIFEKLNLDVDIKRCKTDEFPRPAKRPRYSSLENDCLSKIGLDQMRNYKDALNDFLDQFGGALLESTAE